MSHNYEERPVVGWRLTIADRDGDVLTATVNHHDKNVVFGTQGSDDRTLRALVLVEGEDLYALRAALNELPEEAFVEPAPAKPRWTDGDVVRHDKGNLYVRDGGRWRNVTSGGSATFDDDLIEGCLKTSTSRSGLRILHQASGQGIA